jgi:MoaA/NifB/PqqE/SkfB family radical SAM enzyme
MLTPERGRSLWEAGVSQFNISLDYVDGRHDAERGIPGLTGKILTAVSAMRSGGINAIRFNTVIKRENIDHLPEIVRVAQELRIGVNFSVYTDFKNGNRDHLIEGADIDHAESVIGELLALKRHRRGVITNSDYYLEQIPRYLRGELTEPCQSGIRTIHIDPSGMSSGVPTFPRTFTGATSRSTSLSSATNASMRVAARHRRRCGFRACMMSWRNHTRESGIGNRES